MKKFVSILVLLSVFSYAGLGDFLKSAGKALTETCDKCNAEFTEFIDVNNTCSSYVRNEQEFNRCSDFVKNCKCWTTGGDSQRDNEFRAYRFQEIKNALIKYSQEKEAKIKEQAREDSIGKVRLLEQAKQDSIKRETERQKQATRDSIQQEDTKEILALIGNKTETSLILDKCNKYSSKYSKSLQECNAIRDSMKYDKITALLKANKLEESLDECQQIEYGSDKRCFEECMQSVIGGGVIKQATKEECLSKCGQNEKLVDLCKKQLTAKIKKLPKNKINSAALAYVYYDCEIEDKCPKIMGYVFQNDGKMMLIQDLVWNSIVMVQHTGHIGECQLRPNREIPFAGYGKYLGEKVYTTVLGVRQSVPNYQLLWCGNWFN